MTETLTDAPLKEINGHLTTGWEARRACSNKGVVVSHPAPSVKVSVLVSPDQSGQGAYFATIHEAGPCELSQRTANSASSIALEKLQSWSDLMEWLGAGSARHFCPDANPFNEGVCGQMDKCRWCTVR